MLTACMLYEDVFLATLVFGFLLPIMAWLLRRSSSLEKGSLPPAEKLRGYYDLAKVLSSFVESQPHESNMIIEPKVPALQQQSAYMRIQPAVVSLQLYLQQTECSSARLPTST